MAAASAWCSLPPGDRINELMLGSSSAATLTVVLVLPSVAFEAWEASAAAGRPREMWAPVSGCSRASARDCCCGSGSDRLLGQLVPRGLPAAGAQRWKQRQSLEQAQPTTQ